MESDLPLIEIAGEDDSLLLDHLPDPDETHTTIPNLATTTSSYFACSPLQLSMIKPRLPHSKGFKARMDPAKPSCSSPQSSSNKENINVNKSEVPKLSVEPLQMKKRKKGGGYNLRKSLAWDRAFDTDEGVLDPLELSMITGAFSKSCREMLPNISEEGSNALYAGSNRTNEFDDLQAVEGTSFTELRDMSRLKEDEEKGRLGPRHNSSAQDNICSTPKATRKVLSTYGGAKSGSKGSGCPKPLAASSLKRPASASTVRVIRKDSKLPKLPASKTGSCLLPPHTRSTTQYSSHLKPNQIAKPAVNIQKTVAAKCSSTNVKCAQTKAKNGPGVAVSRAKDSARNLTHSLLEAQSSTNSRPLQVSRVSSVSEVIPQSEVPSTRLQVREGQMSSASPTTSLPPNPSVTSGKVTNPKILSMKPSGLRMPSPSIGFFGQSKASGSETSMQKSGGPCGSDLGSDVLGTRKFGMSRPPPVPGKTSLIASSSNKQWSSSSASCVVPDKMVKSDLGELTVQNMETEVQSDCKSSESLCWKQNANDNIEAKPGVHQPVDCIQLKQTVSKQDSNLQIINNPLTPKGGSNEHYEGDCGTELENYAVPLPYEDRKQENGGATGVDDLPDQSPAGNAQQLALHGNLSSEYCNSGSITAIEKNKNVEVCEVSNQSPECFESKSHREQEDGGAIVVADVSMESSSGHAQEKASGVNMSSDNYNSDSGTPIKCSKSVEVCEISDQSAKCVESTSHGEQENGGVVGVHDVSDKSPVKHAQQHAASTSSYHRGCLEVCDSSDKSANNLEMKSVCFASEPTFQFNNEHQSDDSMLLVENSCSNEPHCEEAIDTVQITFPERDDVSVRGSNFPIVIITEVPGQLKDDGADIDLVSEQTPMEETHACSLEVSPLIENHEHSSHKTFMLDVTSVGEGMPLESGTYLSTESGLLVQTTQPSLEGSNVPGKVVDQLSHNVVVEEAKSHMHVEDSYDRQRAEASVDSLFLKSIAVEDAQFYLGEAGDGQGCDTIMETSYCQIETADQADNNASRVDKVPKPHLDAQIQLFNGDRLVGSCSNDAISHDQSTKIAGPLEVFGEHPELPDSSLKVQQVLVDNQDNILLDSEGSFKESLLENVVDVPEDVCGCDLETLAVITQAATAELENCHDFADGQPSLDVTPSGSPVMDSTDYNELSNHSRIIRSIESSGQPISSVDFSLEVRKDHSTSLSATFAELRSVREISLATGPVNKIFGEQPEESNSYREVEEVLMENNQAIMKDYLFPKKIIVSEEVQHDNVEESLTDVPEGSFIYENDPNSSNVVVQVPLAAEGMEFSEDGQSYLGDGPSVSFKSSSENHEYVTAGQFSPVTEISGQAPSGIDLDLNTSKEQIASPENTSEFCSLPEASCSLAGGDTNLPKSSSQLSIGGNGLKRSYQDDTATKDDSRLAGESDHELETARDLEKDMDATLSIKSLENKMKLDIPLIKPPPNAVPFSDEWLAAIEAAGEDILTLKSGAVQNSPPDKSVPEPSPWSPVKRKNIQLGPFDCTKKLGNTLPGDPSN